MKAKLPYIVYEVTQKCNLDCLYCYNIWKRDKSTSENITESYKKSLKTLKRLFSVAEVDNITFSGGEPLLSERFLELVLFCRMNGKNVTVISNGNNDIEMYEQLNKLGVYLFELPLHSDRETEHDEMCVNNGAWKNSLESIKYLLSINANVIPVIVLTKINYKRIEETLIFIKNLGLNNIMINRFNIGGNGIHHIDKILCDNKTLRDSFKIINRVTKEHRLSVSSNVCTPFCILNPKDFPDIRFGRCSLDFERMPITLDIQGNLRLCNHSPVIIGNIFKINIEEIRNHSSIKEWGERIPDYCSECSLYKECLSGCRASSLQMGYSFDTPDPIVLK